MSATETVHRNNAEADMFKAAIEHWKKPGREIFQELRVRRLFPDGDYKDRRPLLLDALFREGGIMSAVEGKVAIGNAGLCAGLTMELYKQCKRWQGHAHCVYALVKAPQGHYARSPESEHLNVLKLMKLDGIGVITWEGLKFDRVLKARMNVAPDFRCMLAAIDTHRNHLPAGSAGGRRSNPRDRQWDWILTALREDHDIGGDGLTALELGRLKRPPLSKIERGELMKAATKGHIAGVRAREVNGIRRLYLEQEQD